MVDFGCPALLNLHQSKDTKDYITSVVTDTDIISRMSGPLIVGMFINVMTRGWIDVALVDTEHLVDHTRKTLSVYKEM